ncbi:MAG: MarR family winged helix-turn-helix transcriptional regulator [Actinomycetota bacterium]|nr:MarR family winged helix-turn-helix transcriptional regulator [Actinomycetota bacterium]
MATSRPSSRFQTPEQSPGFLLWRTTLAWQRRMRLVLTPHALTHVQFVLLASLWWLEEHDGQPPTQVRLAAQAGTDPMMTSQVIRKLEARGLLERAIDPLDARTRRLQMTARARAGVASALADVEAADDDYFAPIGDGRDAFLDALCRLDAADRVAGTVVLVDP